jgi:predicted RNase H-like HicB family nuclease
MRQVVYVYAQRAESGFVAECYDLPVSAQGESLDQVIDEIQAAIDDYLASNDPPQFGISPKPEVIVTFQLGRPPED